MTKEEIIKQNLDLQGIHFVHSLVKEAYLKAMDEYGRQCFDASKEMDESCELYFDRLDKYQIYEDYLKELENKQ